MTRSEFESAFAALGLQTPVKLGELGWHSGKHDGDWRAVCAPPDLPEEKRREILAGLVNACRFGEIPPVNGTGAGG